MIEERTVSYGKYQLKIFNSPVVFLNIKNRKEVSMGKRSGLKPAVVHRLIRLLADEQKRSHNDRDTCKRDNSQSLHQPLMRHQPQSLQWRRLPLFGIICSMYAFFCFPILLYGALCHLTSVQQCIYSWSEQKSQRCFFRHKESAIKRAAAVYVVNREDRGRTASHK